MSVDYSDLIEYLDTKFTAIDARFVGVDTRFEALENRLLNLEEAFGSLERQVSQLPTKKYMNDKFAELEGRLTTKIRKCVYKTDRLVDMLKENKTIKDYEYKELQQFDFSDGKK